jgi:hypothetical protein
MTMRHTESITPSGAGAWSPRGNFPLQPWGIYKEWQDE